MNQNSEFGPRKLSFLTFLTRALAGLGGGVCGTVILLLVFFTASSTFISVLRDGLAEITPLLVFVFMAMVFLASLGSNVLGVLFIGLADREKYRHLTSAVFQIFAVNLLIFVVLAPLYLLLTNINPNVVIFMAGLQVILSAQASFLVLEVISDTRYALLGVYTAILSSLAGTLTALFIFQLSSENITILLLISLPLIWGFLGLFSGLFELLYYVLYDLYGIDFLRSDTRFGRDEKFDVEGESGVSEADEKLILDQQEEQRGGEFLRKKKG